MILACIHVNGPGGRLIQDGITVHGLDLCALFAVQYVDDGVLYITSRLACAEQELK